MNRIIFLLCVLITGYLLRRFAIVHSGHISFLNKLIIFFFIPLLTIVKIPTIELSNEMLWLSLSPFIIFIMGWVFFKYFGKLLGLQQQSVQALTLTGGISSTSFVGFPIFESLYGDIGLSYGVLLSLGGTILVFNTIGIGLLLKYSKNSISLISLLKRMLTFLPFTVFLLALGMNFLSINLPTIVHDGMSFIVSPFSAIAILAVGMQVKFSSFQNYRVELLLGQTYKLLLAPFMIFVIGTIFYQANDLIFQISVLGAGIGSMNAMSILTAEKKICPNLAIAMPAIGIPLSVCTVFIIHYLIN